MLKKNLLKISATLGAAALGVAATASVANADTVYTVQSGDTLSGISQKFANNNSLVDSLAKNNNIQNINLIYVGQQLLIKDNGEITQATQAQAQTLPSANTTSTASSQASTNTQAQATTPATSTAATTTTSSSDDAAKSCQWSSACHGGVDRCGDYHRALRPGGKAIILQLGLPAEPDYRLSELVTQAL